MTATSATPPMPTPFSIRRLGPADARAFRDLHLEALATCPAAFAASWEEEKDVPLPDYAARLDHLWVFGGFVDGELAGMATLQRQPQRKRRHMAMVWGMYVRERMRGGGLAEAIFAAVLDEAARQVDQIELYVAVGNERAARFYKRHGFEPYGVMRRSLRVDGVDHDAEMLVRIFR